MSNIKKYIFIQIPLVILFISLARFLSKYGGTFIKNKVNDISNLKTCTTTIFDQNNLPVGEIDIDRKDTFISCSINGRPIKGVSYIDRNFSFSSIAHDKILFELREVGGENYYYSNEQNSVKLILKIKKENISYLSNSLKDKNAEIYMYAEYPESLFAYVIDSASELGLQEICISDMASCIYCCYFLLS